MCNNNTSLPSYPNLKKSEPSPPKEKRDLVNAFLKAFPQDELPFKTEHQQYRKRVPDCKKYLYYLCIADEKRFKEEHKLRSHLYPESWKQFRNCCLDLVIDQNFKVPKPRDRKRDYSRLFQERLAWLPTMYQEVVGLPFTMNTKVEIPSVNCEIYPAFFSKSLIVMVAPNIKNNIQAMQQMVYALCFSSETQNPDGVLMDEEDIFVICRLNDGTLYLYEQLKSNFVPDLCFLFGTLVLSLASRTSSEIYKDIDIAIPFRYLLTIEPLLEKLGKKGVNAMYNKAVRRRYHELNEKEDQSQ
ncbi:hypothetical protein C9374_012656 [Naegleria lovaniensis]|uniref:Uncharacterized protein n=1 Tax=Naegleria lovaniensis TaxID=51637 RepID=A0AA88H2E0_NAELO|nr:uncharacterized protein C9374_012656 [Naegleria lovaniensis]KAG2392404.1 hypothetical protein C9374_012656 [Naegleria lovaniensis]